MTNFAGPDLVKRVVAAEVFHVWAKRRGDAIASGAAGSDGGESTNCAKTDPPPPSPAGGAKIALPATGKIGNLDGADRGKIRSVETSSFKLADHRGPNEESATAAAAVEGPAVGGVATARGEAVAAGGGAVAVAVGGGAVAAGRGTVAVGGGAVALTSAAALNGDMDGAGLAANTTTPPTPAMEVEVGLSPAPMTSPGGGGGGGERSPTLKITDDDVINLAGPVSSPGGPRIELKMTVGELRKARLSRSAEFKQLLMAMLNDPIVQAGELDVVTQSNCPTPRLTEHNSSGAAAAAAAARSQAAAARALEDTTRAMALLASGRERDKAEGHGGGGYAEGPAPVPNANGNAQETRSGGGFSNGGGGGGSMDLGLAPPPPREQRLERRGLTTESADPGGAVSSAEKLVDPSLHRVKRGRPDNELGGEGGGGKRASGTGSEGLGAGVVGVGGEHDGDGCGLASSSKRRRRLWMLAIRENEMRHERRKEEARKEYETRQQELLRWMIDEEAGRHNDLDGDAGPPPIAKWERGGGSHAL